MRQTASFSDYAVRLDAVSMVYPPKQAALSDLSVSIRHGEFVFVAGASGAGKSTLLKLIFAQEQATRGQIEVAGNSLSHLDRTAVAELRRNIGVIFQDYKLLPSRSVLENVAFGLEVLNIRKSDRLKLARRMLSALGLERRLSALPNTLSGGEQQRVAIARALVNGPAIILADEPTGNLDPDMAKSVFDLLLEAQGCGATVIVASHNLELIERLNKRTLVLDQGKLVGDFTRPGGGQKEA